MAEVNFEVTVNGIVRVPPNVVAMIAGSAVPIDSLWVAHDGIAEKIYDNPFVGLSAPSDGQAVEVPGTDHGQVDASWTLNTTSEDRVVLQKSDDGVNWQNSFPDLSPGTELVARIDVTEGEEWFFRVRVEKETSDGTKVSPWHQFSVVTGLDGITNLSASAGVESVDLNWTNNGPYDTIEVHRDGSLLTTIGGGNTSSTDTGLTAGVQHCYRVKGETTDETSPLSNEACATAQAGVAPERLFPVSDEEASASGTGAQPWEDTDGDGALWDDVNEEVPDDTDYVWAGTSAGSNASVSLDLRLGLSNPAEAHDDTQTWVAAMRGQVEGQLCAANVAGTFSLYDSSFATVSERTIASRSVTLTETWQTFTMTLADAEVNAINDLSALELRFEASFDSPCCSSCDTQFASFSALDVRLSWMELDIS